MKLKPPTEDAIAIIAVGLTAAVVALIGFAIGSFIFWLAGLGADTRVISLVRPPVDTYFYDEAGEGVYLAPVDIDGDSDDDA